MKGMDLIVMVRATTDFFGAKFWEVDVHEGDKIHRNIRVYLSDMKKRGVTNTLNGKRKMSEWINETKEGQRYIRSIVCLPQAIAPTEPPSAAAAGKDGTHD
ncbi:hypothetical protein AMQ84_27070 [Paenibacillus riograndensis]|uniref:Uncharacterized protein n=1 Tax=Paenibacillus riograndensis TaxID=483937 RepID=A0A132TJS8_9BACL|nr:hypothetical protein [Paenibacillus riograndensis]KWX71588.1 hypothetical protein AMQ84_27070 [Paenibacillus riograndensis]